MDYLTKLRKEHEVLRGMADVFKELIKRLNQAKAVNLLDLEDVYKFWAKYLLPHLSWEENHFFLYLQEVNNTVVSQLIQRHEEIKEKTGQVGEAVRRLRAGYPNSGRRLVKEGETFLWYLESHLQDEHEVLNDVEEKKEEISALEVPGMTMISEERLLTVHQLSALVERLSWEYLGNKISLSWLLEEGRQLQKAEETEVETEEEKEEKEASAPHSAIDLSMGVAETDSEKEAEKEDQSQVLKEAGEEKDAVETGKKVVEIKKEGTEVEKEAAAVENEPEAEQKKEDISQ